MNMIDGIKSRRSIRRYTGQLISEEQLRTILEAGFQAPSAHNLEPRQFLVVQDSDKLEEIAARHKYAKMLPKAGSGIIVLGDRRKQVRDGLLVADCSASLQNMLLTAHAMDLGAVWIGLHPIEGFVKLVRDLFDLPEYMLPVGMMAVGFPDEKRRQLDRFNEAMVHREEWNDQ